MASISLTNLCKSFAIIWADREGVPISFPIGNDGLASVSSIRLDLWFQLNIASLHIDDEVLNSKCRAVSHNIGQILVNDGDGKYSLLRPGRFRLYGLSESTMATSQVWLHLIVLLVAPIIQLYPLE
jgi:hypothetical protein